MSGAWYSPDGLVGWWLTAVAVAIVVVLVTQAMRRHDRKRNAEIHNGDAFKTSHGRVFEIARAEPRDLGHGFELEQTGGFRRR